MDRLAVVRRIAVLKRLAALMALALLVFVGAGGAGERAGAAPPACKGAAPPSSFSHVVWIVMENRSYEEVTPRAAPYIDGLRCGQATNYHNITHPSLPNYLALASGQPRSTLPTTDCGGVVCAVDGPSIFGQLEAAGKSWSAYAESMPAACYGRDNRPYVVHHNPVPFFRDVAASCATHDLPLTRLDPGNLPALSVVVPNIVNDMHENSSSVAAGDAWLSGFLPTILGSADYQAGRTVVFLTWDEGGLTRRTKDCALNTTDIGCHILTEVIAPSVPRDATSSTLFNHYSLLRTTEELLGLPLLGLASTASSMRADFGLGAAAPAKRIRTTTKVKATQVVGKSPGKVVFGIRVKAVKGVAVPEGTVILRVDKGARVYLTLRPTGRVSYTRHYKPGSHTVSVRYTSSTTHSGSSATIAFTVT